MNGESRLLCPICKLNIRIVDFVEHLDRTNQYHPTHQFLKPLITDKVLRIWHNAEKLKNYSDNIHFNWEYLILSTYNPTKEEIEAFDIIRQKYTKTEERRKAMSNIDHKFDVPFIGNSIIHLLGS